MTGKILTSKCFIVRLWNGKTSIGAICLDKHWVMGFSPSKVPILPIRHDLKFDAEFNLPSFCRVFPPSLRKILELRRFTEANAATLGSQMLVAWWSYCLAASQPAPLTQTPQQLRVWTRRSLGKLLVHNYALNKASFYFRQDYVGGIEMAGHFRVGKVRCYFVAGIC